MQHWIFVIILSFLPLQWAHGANCDLHFGQVEIQYSENHDHDHSGDESCHNTEINSGCGACQAQISFPLTAGCSNDFLLGATEVAPVTARVTFQSHKVLLEGRIPI
jgi:hypothetical protein